jgi:hypothetical protein
MAGGTPSAKSTSLTDIRGLLKSASAISFGRSARRPPASLGAIDV